MDLTADCARCAALCCIGLAFDRSSLFALDKPAGVRCPHLTATNACDIHDELDVRGFSGCRRFDCDGAGQRTHALFGAAPAALEAFRVIRTIHELLQLLHTAGRLPLRAEHARTRNQLRRELEQASVEGFERGDLEARTRAFLRGLQGVAGGGHPESGS